VTLAIRYLGGPTSVIEISNLRLLTDPTFDAAGDYPIGNRVLRKTSDAVVTPAEVGDVDAVLLSHDQHPDNLDHGGWEYVARATCCLSTPDAAHRLAGTVRGLSSWDSVDLGAVTVTAVPAQHGPDGCEAVTGQVTGFVLDGPDVPRVYISGDNASLDVVHAIVDRLGRRFDVAVLFAGAARTALFDGALLTLSSAQAAQAARILGVAHVVPLPFEGWGHFTQGRDTLQAAFAHAGLAQRLHLLDVATTWRLP
jgi:L-ascorbate metabolism protein UlaG (beta-lactamase superfamily)